MATGVCGINCDVCGLKVKNICTGCKAGTEWSVAAIEGHPCPILKCAVEKSVAYCIRDCPKFPCNTLKEVDFPFSSSWLGMHHSRMKPK